MSSRRGEFVTESLEYDGGRQVTAYVPAAAAEAVVFAGDGQLITSWGAELVLAMGLRHPTSTARSSAPRRGRLPAACRAARPDSAYAPRRRHGGTVLLTYDRPTGRYRRSPSTRKIKM